MTAEGSDGPEEFPGVDPEAVAVREAAEARFNEAIAAMEVAGARGGVDVAVDADALLTDTLLAVVLEWAFGTSDANRALAVVAGDGEPVGPDDGRWHLQIAVVLGRASDTLDGSLARLRGELARKTLLGGAPSGLIVPGR